MRDWVQLNLVYWLLLASLKYIHTNTSTHPPTYTHIHLHTHTPTNTHTHPHTHTHTMTHTQVKVFQCPSIGVLSTGNEVIEPGQPLLAGQIHDSNRTTLIAAVKEQGFTPLDLGITRDEYVTISTCDVCVCVCLCVCEDNIFHAQSAISGRLPH